MNCVFYNDMWKDVNCTAMRIVQRCELYRDVTCTEMWTVQRFELHRDVKL